VGTNVIDWNSLIGHLRYLVCDSGDLLFPNFISSNVKANYIPIRIRNQKVCKMISQTEIADPLEIIPVIPSPVRSIATTGA